VSGEVHTVAQQRNLASLRAWVDAYNARDYEGLAETEADGFRLHDPATGTDISGPDAFDDIARQVAQIYPNRRISVTQMIPLGDSAVAMEGAWEGTAVADSPAGRNQGEVVHRVESMVVELVDGKITVMRIYR